ncbi:flagellar biosynthesis protein FlgL [Geomonas sp. Red32]|uniref:flagellin N-terminal helical domain-containing protein n=1 Tax=Geomonas sp. Red32 TaxID=2912856 RepID=UPI00202D0350|nr:flagellar biosynthesis protein FlgL [Geomonas sp. Red32]MCM0081168.1 flagellar biosynthesis protein FlgL [Geomonas sp. Red32]
MRITANMTADNALYNIQQQRQTLDALQEQASSGNLVNRPSDNPLSTRQILDIQNQIASGDQYNSNIQKAQLLLNVSSTALNSMGDIMTQVKQIAGKFASGSTDSTAIAGAVSNLTQLKGQLIDLGNTQYGDQYVFGGFKNGQPFDAAGNFTGTSDSLNIPISSSSQVSTSVSGGNLLRGGTPPAAVGSGATAGNQPVDVLGGIDALITAISTNNTSAINDGIKNMKAGSDQLNASISDVAGRLTRLSNMQSMITNNQNTLKDAYGNLQNVDLAKVGVQLSQQTTAFNAALSTTAKLTQLSLLDYMQ